MDKKYESLFTPWKIGNVEIKNRIVMTSMGGTCLFGWMERNHFDKEAAKLLLEIAKNNCGLILPGIAPLSDIILGKKLSSGKKKFRQLKEYMEEFHKTGCKLFIQLTAGFGRSLAMNSLMCKAAKNKALGLLLKPILNVSYLTASASATPNRWDNTCYSRPLTKKEIQNMINEFAKVSKLCKEAGVDGVEVHAVHEGYLLDQFTLPYANQRTDEYGGSFENRYRFPVEIVKAIKKECGKDFPVSLRYSVVSKTKGFQQGALPNEKYKEVGRDLNESLKAAKYLQDAGYDMLNCDNGTYDAWYWAHPPVYMPDNCNLKDVEELKKAVNIPVVCAGKMTLDVGAKAISENKIDGLGIARQFLSDPTWISKLIEDRLDDIKPCIRCHNACFNMAHYNGVGNDQSLGDNASMCRCAVNPVTMKSNKYKIVPAKHKKNIAIIGGGIGGMECAIVLTKRGHKVTIYEKSNKLGGVFVAAAAPSFKVEDKKLLAWYSKQLKDLKIEVKFNKEIKDINEINADEYIIATGAKARRIRMENADKAIDAVDYLNGAKVGNRVLVIGGGLTGCEIAYDLFNKGHTPTIVEMKNDLIAVRGVCLANSSYLREFFALNKVAVYLNSSLAKIDKNNVATIKEITGKEFKIPFDSIVTSIGYTPNPLTKKSKHIHLVGDCDSVANLKKVIWQAWDVAMKI